MYNKVIARTDGSFVIEKNNLPYHVPNEGEYKDEWIKITNYIKKHPEIVEKEQPFILTEEQIIESIRIKRKSLLAETDYLVMSDYPISESSLMLIKEYRRKLRDITKQEGFPHNVIWPEKPEI